MEKEQILTKAIEKAEKNGFKGDWKNCGIACEAHSLESEGECSYTTIFSHDFAKAFWGEEMAHIRHGVVYVPKTAAENYSRDNDPLFPIWQYHLQQCVLCDNPLHYLENFLDKTTT